MSCSSCVLSQFSTTSPHGSVPLCDKDAGEQLALLCEERTSIAGNHPDGYRFSLMGLSRPRWGFCRKGQCQHDHINKWRKVFFLRYETIGQLKKGADGPKRELFCFALCFECIVMPDCFFCGFGERVIFLLLTKICVCHFLHH